MSRQNIGFQHFRQTSFCRVLSTSQNCGGGSNEIMRSSNKKWDSGILRDGVGEASITTVRCASRPTDSWSLRGRRFPPCGPRPARLFEELAVHPGYRPRGASDKARASHTKLDRHHAATPHRCACTTPLTLPVLQPPVRTDEAFSLVTQ